LAKPSPPLFFPGLFRVVPINAPEDLSEATLYKDVTKAPEE
jgi:hypothetical protein